jgi:hypothetical protein
MAMMSGVDRIVSASTVRLTWWRMSTPRAAMVAIAFGVAGAPPGSSPADPTDAPTPDRASSLRSRPSAMGDRHWLAVQTNKMSMTEIVEVALTFLQSLDRSVL